MEEQYRIKDYPVDDNYGFANAVFVNEQGEWLGQWWPVLIDGKTEERIDPFTDRDGFYMPAPEGWREWIIEKDI